MTTLRHDQSLRVRRSGSWRGPAWHASFRSRDWASSGHDSAVLGFRLVRRVS